MITDKNGQQNNDPKVTVIVPVYNVEPFLEECVQSILAQSYENIEIVLVDDGSTDNSGKMCDGFRLKDDRIVVIHKENGGLSSARNAGIEAAAGDYYLFVDSDDVISPAMIDTMVSKAIEYDTDIVSSLITEDMALLETGDREKVKTFTVPEGLKSIFSDGLVVTSSSGKMYAASLWDDIRFPTDRIFEDFATIYKVIMASKGMIVSFEDYNYYYRPNPNSITKASFSHKRMQFYDVASSVMSDMQNEYSGLVPVIRKRVTRQSISYYRDMSKSGYDDKEDIRYVIRMVRKGIFKYLFSSYNFKSKMYGVMIALFPRWARSYAKKI